MNNEAVLLCCCLFCATAAWLECILQCFSMKNRSSKIGFDESQLSGCALEDTRTFQAKLIHPQMRITHFPKLYQSSEHSSCRLRLNVLNGNVKTMFRMVLVHTLTDLQVEFMFYFHLIVLYNAVHFWMHQQFAEEKRRIRERMQKLLACIENQEGEKKLWIDIKGDMALLTSQNLRYPFHLFGAARLWKWLM